MVNKAVAVAGLVLLTVGVAMTAVIMVIEEWVVVTLPGTPACDDTPLGNLGLYTATYNPECTPADSQFNLFKKTESSTTEFWPLFPVQAQLGGFSKDKLGVEAPAFTSCEEYFSGESESVSKFSTDVATFIGGSKTAGDTLLANIFAAGNVAASVDGAALTLDGTVANLFSNGFDGAANGTIDKLAPAFPQLQGLVGGIIIPTIQAAMDTPVSIPDENINTDFASAIDFTGAEAELENTTVTSFAQVLANINVATLTPTVVTATAGSSSPLNATEAATALATLKALMGAVVGASPFCATSTLAECFGSAALTDADALAIDPTLVFVNGLATLDPTNVLVQQAIGLFGACKLVGAATGAACKASPVFTAVPEDISAEWVFCSVAASIIPGLAPFAQTADCTAVKVLEVGSTDPTLLGGLPAALQPLVPNLAAAFTLCGEKGLTKTQCYDALKDDGIPADYTLPYGLCLQSADCVSFLEFPAAAPAIEGFPASAASSVSLLSLLLSLCTASGLTLDAQCDPFVSNPTVVIGLLGFFYDAPEGVTDPTAIVESYEAQCVDDEEDARRIELAQVLVPISISAEGVALLLGVAVVILAKGPLAIAAGVLSLAGFALTLSALLLVRGAPVYQSVGGDEVIGEPYYSAGQAETFGLIAIATPLLAGISFIVAGLLNRGDSESALTSKVENTY